MYYFQKKCVDCGAIYHKNELSKDHFEGVSDNPGLTFSQEDGDHFLTIHSSCGCNKVTGPCGFCGSTLGYEADPRGSGYPACRNCGGV
jgi:DNA-directed RNA polymerase subunit RPC12/RpoP